MTQGDIIMHNNKLDSKNFGQSIKTARLNKKLTRDDVSEKLNISSRYLMSIENNGQHPSLQVFYNLATMFQLSVDQFFFPEAKPAKSSQRKQVDELLDNLSDKELAVIEATARALKSL